MTITRQTGSRPKLCSPVAALRANRALQVILAVYVLVWLLTAIDPIDRREWLLENLLVVAFLAIMVPTYRVFRFSNTSYLLMMLFLSLHAVGAHYAYVFTPPGEWLMHTYAFTRNHYDRIVHLSFGLLMIYPLHEWLMRKWCIRGGWNWLLSGFVIMGAASLYELLEFWVMQLNPQLGADFLGTQGDIWDTQQDLAMALYGLLITAIPGFWLEHRQQRPLLIVGSPRLPHGPRTM